MHGEYSVAGEIDSAVIAVEMRLVIGGVAVVGIAGVTVDSFVRQRDQELSVTSSITLSRTV